MLTHLSLFSGVGGIDLAAEWAGFTTVGQCEWADYPTKVLEKHWPNVPRWRDVRDVTADSVRAAGIERVDLLSGGFPCQPHSVAGKRRASDDERDLWPELARVIGELKPRWFLGENVPGLLSSEAGRFFGRVLGDLATLGYRVGWIVYGAKDVGAPHRRERVFIVGYSKHDGLHGSTEPRSIDSSGNNHEEGKNTTSEPSGTGGRECGSDVAYSEHERRIQREFSARHWQGLSESGSTHIDVAYTQSEGLPECQGCSRDKERFSRLECGSACEFRRAGHRSTQSILGRVLDGLPNWLDVHRWPAGFGQEQCDWEPPRVATGIKHRADRLKCLGNAVVPQQAYVILKAIADIEMGRVPVENHTTHAR